jgi:3-dehydroquinate dehydratase type I
MQKYNPLIKKIATMVRNDEDRRVLLQLLLNKKTKEKLCVIGMGGGGKIIRITSPLLGGEMTYCTIGIHGKTASGQISCSEMKEVYKLLS